MTKQEMAKAARKAMRAFSKTTQGQKFQKFAKKQRAGWSRSVKTVSGGLVSPK